MSGGRYIDYVVRIRHYFSGEIDATIDGAGSAPSDRESIAGALELVIEQLRDDHVEAISSGH